MPRKKGKKVNGKYGNEIQFSFSHNSSLTFNGMFAFKKFVAGCTVIQLERENILTLTHIAYKPCTDT